MDKGLLQQSILNLSCGRGSAEQRYDLLESLYPPLAVEDIESWI